LEKPAVKIPLLAFVVFAETSNLGPGGLATFTSLLGAFTVLGLFSLQRGQGKHFHNSTDKKRKDNSIP